MSPHSDPVVQAYLKRALVTFRESGTIELVQEVVRDTWAANRARYRPDDCFDDTLTLGYQTSRNVLNRLRRCLDTGRTPPLAHIEVAQEVAILTVGDKRLRVVKAPTAKG